SAYLEQPSWPALRQMMTQSSVQRPALSLAQPAQHSGRRLERAARRWRYSRTGVRTVAETAGRADVSLRDAAASCASDLHLEWTVEDDALAALDKRVDVSVEFAEVRDRQWLHEWRQPLRLAVV